MKVVKAVSAEEKSRIAELFFGSFEFAMDRSKPFEKPEGTVHFAALDEDGEMMSSLAVMPFDVRFDNAVEKLGGIGDVCTLPQYRRRGGVRACFEAFLPDLYARGFGFSYLYPFSTVFYRQFGYESCSRSLNVTLDLRLLRKSSVPGSFRLSEPRRPLDGDVKEIDRVWQEKYNLTVQHDALFYDTLRKADPFALQEYCYVYYSAEGRPLAYAVYHPEGKDHERDLCCSRFVFADAEGFAGLISLFGSVASHHRYALFSIPAEESMQYLLPEWSLGAVSWELKSAGMVRVVNVEKILREARYCGSGRVVLRIKDPVIAENDRCFAVAFSDGKADAVTVTDEAPDVILDIGAFSVLICGTAPFSEVALWLRGVQLCRKDAPLDSVFFRKPLYIADHF